MYYVYWWELGDSSVSFVWIKKCVCTFCGNILVAVHTSRKIRPHEHRRSFSATFPQVNDFFFPYSVNVPGTEDQQLTEVTEGGQMSSNESVLQAAPLCCTTSLSV